MRVTLRGIMMLITMICITMAVIGRPMYLLCQDDAIVGTFLNSYRHLSYLAYQEPEYYEYESRNAIPGLLGFLSSAMLHLAAIFFFIVGWVNVFYMLGYRPKIRVEEEVM